MRLSPVLMVQLPTRVVPGGGLSAALLPCERACGDDMLFGGLCTRAADTPAFCETKNLGRGACV